MRIIEIISKPAAGVAVVALLALSMGLVAAQQAQKPIDLTNMASVTILSKMSAAAPIPISAARGSEITITLASNHTTGYSWRLANKPNAAVVKFLRSEYVAPNNTGRVGQGGVEALSFRAVGRGTSTIVLEYARPWEKNVQPAKKQVFSVMVK